MRIRINKQLLLFLFFFYGFLFNEQLSGLIPWFGYGDELLAVLAIPLYVLRNLKRRERRNRTGAAPYVAGFAVCGLIGSLVYGYQAFFAAALPDLLLCVKFWLCIYTAGTLFRGFDIVRFADRIFTHIRLITWAFFFLSGINLIFGMFPSFDTRFGLRANSLFYSHPTTLAACCSFLIIVLLALKNHVAHCFFYAGLLAAVMCSTLRTKAFADVLVFGLVCFIAAVRKQKLSLRSLLPIIPASACIGWAQVEYYFVTLRDVSARAQLLLKAFSVAGDHFPWGAGFGTYGSHFSAVHYSPLYYMYGLNGIHGLGLNGTGFICDSFWPMILGQTGYSGLIFYLMALYKLMGKLVGLKRRDLYHFVSGLCAMGYLLIDSTASTAFVHPLSMPIAMWLGILLANASDGDCKEEGCR